MLVGLLSAIIIFCWMLSLRWRATGWNPVITLIWALQLVACVVIALYCIYNLRAGIQ